MEWNEMKGKQKNHSGKRNTAHNTTQHNVVFIFSSSTKQSEIHVQTRLNKTEPVTNFEERDSQKEARGKACTVLGADTTYEL